MLFAPLSAPRAAEDVNAACLPPEMSDSISSDTSFGRRKAAKFPNLSETATVSRSKGSMEVTYRGAMSSAKMCMEHSWSSSRTYLTKKADSQASVTKKRSPEHRISLMKLGNFCAHSALRNNFFLPKSYRRKTSSTPTSSLPSKFRNANGAPSQGVSCTSSKPVMALFAPDFPFTVSPFDDFPPPRLYL